MKKKILGLVKIILPLLLGVFLVWYIYNGFSEKDKDQIFEHIGKANYGWIAFSLVFAWLAHLSRAWRWKYTLEPLGMKPRFWNSYHSVMIGYLANLAFPRLGEASRCAAMARYERMPFDKLFGTVIAERVADLVILVALIFSIFIFQTDKIQETMDTPVNQLLHASGDTVDPSLSDQTIAEVWADKIPPVWVMITALVGLIVVGFLGLRFLRTAQHPIARKVRDFVQGILDGVKSILHMKDRWWFIGHTVFIWIMYVLMFYVCFFSLPGTDKVPIMGVITGFVMGGISIVVVQGGLGLYPAMIMLTLAAYGVATDIGFAFGWIVWTAQTILLIFLGLVSIILMPIFNKNNPLPDE